MKNHINVLQNRIDGNINIDLCKIPKMMGWWIGIKPITQVAILYCDCKVCMKLITKYPNLTEKWQIENNGIAK